MYFLLSPKNENRHFLYRKGCRMYPTIICFGRWRPLTLLMESCRHNSKVRLYCFFFFKIVNWSVNQTCKALYIVLLRNEMWLLVERTSIFTSLIQAGKRWWVLLFPQPLYRAYQFFHMLLFTLTLSYIFIPIEMSLFLTDWPGGGGFEHVITLKLSIFLSFAFTTFMIILR